MKIVELILDDNEEITGIEAISVVESPAIEEDFVALKHHKEIKLKQIDKEQRILMGPLLIPNRPIFRKKEDEDYYIFFSKSTVKKASEQFLIKGNQGNSTLEHALPVKGLTLVESWIVENSKTDKSALYGFDVPEGTWFGSIKVNNDEIWNDYVKTGKVKGFSIEGYFADKMERPKDKTINDLSEELALELLGEIKDQITDVKLETYNDYPQGAVNNAKRAIEWKEKNGTDCGTMVGWVRARQLATKQKITRNTIARMASFKRHQQNKDVPYSEGCGGLMWDAWGGSAGVNWAISKLKEIDKEKLEQEVVEINENYIIINDRLAYSTKEKAEQGAKDLGCEGFHIHEHNGQEWFMPCEQHALEIDLQKKYKCPEGYVKDYQKHKCVKKEDYAKVGPRGGIRPSKKAPKSNTPNPNPKGKGTAKGNAKSSRGAKVSKQDEATLKKKSDEFNERYKKKLGYGANVGALKSVFQRGLGAFNTSHSPKIKSASAWAFARVNAFLYLIKNGRPQNAKYTADYDLLPKGHPKSSK